jgi:hypothetical protein
MNAPEKDTEQLLAEKRRVEEEAEAAAVEAGQVGGPAPIESDDPALQPLIEAGQGESEGFELAEKRLQDIASHGDEKDFPDSDVRPPEDREQVDHGEADQTIPADA